MNKFFKITVSKCFLYTLLYICIFAALTIFNMVLMKNFNFLDVPIERLIIRLGLSALLLYVFVNKR